MRRRKFLTLVGGAAIMCPLEAHTQQAGKLPRIGFLGAAASSAIYYRSALPAFVRRLGELGFVEGRTVTIEKRFADGSIERAREIAADFVRQNVDIIVSHGDAQVLAAKQATGVIPMSSRPQLIRSAAVWWQAWADLAAMSPAYRLP